MAILLYIMGERTEEQTEEQISIGQMGINDKNEKYYLYTDKIDGGFYSKLVLYDVESGSAKDIYSVSDPERESISEYKITDDGSVIFSVQEGDSKKSYRYDIGTDTVSEAEDGLPDEVYASGKDACIEVGDKKVFFRKEIRNEECYISYDGINFEKNDVLTAAHYKKAGVFNNRFSCEGSFIYGVFTEGSSIGHGPVVAEDVLRNRTVEKEMLFTLNIQTNECSVVYETKNGVERIVGFDGESVYLIEANSVVKYNPESKEKEKIYDIETEEDADLKINWLGRKMILFDADECRVIKVLDL